MVERGEITMTRAYECSKLATRCSRWSTPKTGTPVCRPSPIPRRAAIKASGRVAAWPTSLRSSTMFARTNGTTLTAGLDARKMEPVTLDLTECETDALLNIEPASNYHIRVRMLDPADTNEVIAESLLTTRDLFDAAKRLYINRDDLAAYKAEVKRASVIRSVPGRRRPESGRRWPGRSWRRSTAGRLHAAEGAGPDDP